MCPVPGYIGCYIDDRNRVLPDARFNSDIMSVKECIHFCSTQSPTMRYAGVQYSEECHCGEEGADYNRLGLKRDHECDMDCDGNSDEICGGEWRMSIYDCKSLLIIIKSYYE